MDAILPSIQGPSRYNCHLQVAEEGGDAADAVAETTEALDELNLDGKKKKKKKKADEVRIWSTVMGAKPIQHRIGLATATCVVLTLRCRMATMRRHRCRKPQRVRLTGACRAHDRPQTAAS